MKRHFSIIHWIARILGITYPHLDDLVQKIEPKATWENLLLPDKQIATLKEIVEKVKQQKSESKGWASGTKSPRSIGISALFNGESETGKTMAAEVLANELGLHLFRIDLSRIVSKYIGETEKNLKKIFDAAEGGGAILLFDEADALFGKRSEVRDSHDRFANTEVNYLLQYMEAYQGLAIIASNSKEALDETFLQRIQFIVQFTISEK